MLSEARAALQTKTTAANDENHQLTERLLSHFEAGPSTAESQDPLLQTLRAQKLALSLLHRGVQLPASLLDKVGGCVVSNQVSVPHGLHSARLCLYCDHLRFVSAGFW